MFERILSFQARYRPDAVAIATPVGDASFARLEADVNRMAGRLAAHARPGMRVAVQAAGPGLHWVVLLALARLGCVSASLPPVGERSEAALLALLKPDLLITEREAPAGAPAALRLTPEWVGETFQASAEPVEPHRFAADDPVRIVMSSGTTGSPKAMVFTRAVVDARIKTGGVSQIGQRRVHAAIGVDTETGFRAPLIAWACGKPALYPEVGFRWADFIVRSRPEVLVMVPAQLDALLAGLPGDFAPRTDLSVVLVSGQPSPALFARARARLTREVFVVYGSTEAGLAAQASPGLLATEDGLTGVVSPSAEVEIVDEAGHLLPWGAPGRVRIRSEEMVAGYLDDAAQTARYFQDGWFYPGDLGALSAAGRLSLHGRETEVLELGGARIAPGVIEAALLACPGVEDAAAFSAPAGSGGVHQARAAVVCTPDCALEAVRAELARALPQFAIALLRVERLPRTERGKVDREALRRLAPPPPPPPSYA